MLATFLLLTLQNPQVAMFTAPTYTAKSPWAATFADVTGDGDTDLIYIDYGNDTAGVFTGDGKGNFGGETNFALGQQPISFAVADMNNDGILDFSAVHYNSYDFRFYLGTGGGAFQYWNTTYVGGFPRCLAVGDYNNDGRPDAAIAKSGTGTIQLLTGQGSGLFVAGAELYSGPATYAVILGDLNLDGTTDILGANSGSSDVSVLLGLGGGSFAPTVNYPTGVGPVSLVMGDMNGDFFPDIVTANYTSNDISIRLGDGTGSLAAPNTYPADTNPNHIAIADLNGDGISDVIVPNIGAGSITILRGASGVIPAPSQIPVLSSWPSCILIADVNKDGRPDFAYTNYNSLSIVVALGLETAGCYISAPAVGSTAAIRVADMNNDGEFDVVAAHHDKDVVSIYLGNANGVLAPASTYASGHHPTSLVVGDVNLDSLPDVIIANGENNQCNILRATAPGVLASPVSISTGLNTPASVALGDMNSDGFPDLVVTSSNKNKLITHFGSVAGISPSGIDTNLGLPPYRSYITDVNADGKLDVVSVSFSTSYVDIRMGDGGGGFSNFYWYSTIGNPSSGCIADLNQDGMVEIIAGVSTGYCIFRAVAPGIWTWPFVVPVGGGMSGPISADDMNNDGAADLTGLMSIGWYRYISNSVGDGAMGFAPPVLFSALGSSLGCTADMNHDGFVDYVTDYSNLNVAVLLNQLGMLTSPAGTSHFGGGTPGCAGTLALRANTAPRPNTPNFGLSCANAPASSLGLCIITDSADAAGSDLFSLGILWHVDFLLASEVIALNIFSDAGGVGFAPAPIPNNPLVIGNKYYAQAIWAETAANGRACSAAFAHLVSSRGLEMVIQP